MTLTQRMRIEMLNASLFENLTNLLKKEKFLHWVEKDSIRIEEIKNRGKKGKLQELIIKDIPYDKNGIDIWQFNLEKEVRGISPIANKTVETALACFEDGKLTVFLIEMKSSIREKGNKRTLVELKEKIEDSISRFYFLLLLFLYDPEILKEKGIDFDEFKKSKTKFKGIVLYNNSKIDEHIDKSEKIYKAFKGDKKPIECEPVLGRQKIHLRFHKNPNKNQESFEISFDKL